MHPVKHSRTLVHRSISATMKMRSVVLLPHDDMDLHAAWSLPERKGVALESRVRRERLAPHGAGGLALPHRAGSTGAGAAGDRQDALPGSIAASFGSRQTVR